MDDGRKGRSPVNSTLPGSGFLLLPVSIRSVHAIQLATRHIRERESFLHSGDPPFLFERQCALNFVASLKKRSSSKGSVTSHPASSTDACALESVSPLILFSIRHKGRPFQDAVAQRPGSRSSCWGLSPSVSGSKSSALWLGKALGCENMNSLSSSSGSRSESRSHTSCPFVSQSRKRFGPGPLPLR